MTAPAAEAAAPSLADIRAEIDALDDALHDLLRRRAAAVARLAESRAKGEAPALRPGREAQVLRRLLARHDGPLPPAAVVRLWRDVFAASTGMQGGFAVAVHATPGGATQRLAREHFGALTPLRVLPRPAAALDLVARGEASAAVLAVPREDEAADAADAWWTGLDAPRLQVAARLPFWLPPGAEPGPEALVVTPGAPDPSGEDRSLLRLERDGDGVSRAGLSTALAAAGLPPRSLLLRRAGGRTLALAEVEGAVAADDPRLSALPVDRALPLGFYAAPIRGA